MTPNLCDHARITFAALGFQSAYGHCELLAQDYVVALTDPDSTPENANPRLELLYFKGCSVIQMSVLTIFEKLSVIQTKNGSYTAMLYWFLNNGKVDQYNAELKLIVP